MRLLFKGLLGVMCGVYCMMGLAAKSQETVTLYLLNAKGTGNSVGQVLLEESPFGLLIKPALFGLSPGEHGFHVHENPSCQPKEKDGVMVPGLAAGGHFDPLGTGKHLGPYNTQGHLGDLPVLVVNQQGKAVTPVLAPRLTLAMVRGHALMIHAQGDNYADKPVALGGGGQRLACGVIP